MLRKLTFSHHTARLLIFLVVQCKSIWTYALYRDTLHANNFKSVHEFTRAYWGDLAGLRRSLFDMDKIANCPKEYAIHHLVWAIILHHAVRYF